MKKYLIYFIAIIVLGFSSCEEFEDDRIDLSIISNPYVEFHNGPDTYSLVENDDTSFVRIDLSVTQYEDVEVTFNFEGDAVYGTDFKVADYDGGEVVSANENSATILIKYDTERDDRDIANLGIILPIDDDFSEPNKTLDIILYSAQTVSGKTVNIEKDNTPDTVKFVIGDYDIVPGTYDVTFTGLLAGLTDTQTWTLVEKNEVTGINTYKISRAHGGVFGVNLPWYVYLNKNTGEITTDTQDNAGFGITGTGTGTFNFDNTTFTIAWEDVGGVAVQDWGTNGVKQ